MHTIGEHNGADGTAVLYLPAGFKSPEDMAEQGAQAERRGRAVAIAAPVVALGVSLVEAMTGKKSRLPLIAAAGTLITGGAVMTMLEGRDNQVRAQEIAEAADYRGAAILSR